MNVYLDTSVILRVLFRDPHALPEWGRWSQASASALWEIETRRTIDRARLEGALDDVLVASAHDQVNLLRQHILTVHVTDTILERAGDAFPTVIGTLDAIHLATAIHLRNHMTLDCFLTHDRQLGTAAKAMGFTVDGVNIER